MKVLLTLFLAAGLFSIAGLPTLAKPTAGPARPSTLTFLELALSGTVSGVLTQWAAASISQVLQGESVMDSPGSLCAHLSKPMTGLAVIAGVLIWGARTISSSQPLPFRDDPIFVFTWAGAKTMLSMAGAVAGGQIGSAWICHPSRRPDNKLYILIVASAGAAIASTLGFLLWR